MFAWASGRATTHHGTLSGLHGVLGRVKPLHTGGTCAAYSGSILVAYLIMHILSGCDWIRLMDFCMGVRLGENPS